MKYNQALLLINMLGPYIIFSQLLYLPAAVLLWYRGYRSSQRTDEQECLINVRVNIFGTQVMDLVVFTFLSLNYQICNFTDICIYDSTILLFGVRFMSFFLFTTLSSGFIIDQPIALSGLLHDLYRLGMLLLTFGLMAHGVDPETVALPILALVSCMCILAVHHIIIFAVTPCGKAITALELRKIRSLAIAFTCFSMGFVMFMFGRKVLVEDKVFQGLILGYTGCFSVGLWFWALSMNIEEIEVLHNIETVEFDSEIENRKYVRNKAQPSFKDTHHHGQRSQEISDDEEPTNHDGSVAL